jgi:hypothetical protein
MRFRRMAGLLMLAITIGAATFLTTWQRPDTLEIRINGELIDDSWGSDETIPPCAPEDCGTLAPKGKKR